MKKLIYLFITALLPLAAFSQHWQFELMSGSTGYAGDLTEINPSVKSLGPSAGFFIKYKIHPQVILRTGVLFGSVSGDDKNNKDSLLLKRNLSFKSNITEFHAAVEVNLLDPADSKAYPYIFAGAGLFHFNPYAFDKNGEKTYLQPLSTEGQGLPEYPDRKPYKLTQFCIPFGGGLKMTITEKVDMGIEFGVRKIFTDYLDDVSTRYVDYNVLEEAKGPKAVEMAFRAKTPAGAHIIPVKNDIRGNPGKKDVYYFAGLKFIFKTLSNKQ